jgi:hypothetical protein
LCELIPVIIATFDSPSAAMENHPIFKSNGFACLQDIPTGVRRFTLTRLGFRSVGQEVFDSEGIMCKQPVSPSVPKTSSAEALGMNKDGDTV